MSRSKVAALSMMLVMAMGLFACGSSSQVSSADPDETWGYAQITQAEAERMIEEDPSAVILDVRTRAEYAQGHIPGAICIPNEEIASEQPEGLPDLGQRILVYCRSGNRSKQAAQKLADMGYTNVHEFGGIVDWTGEVVTDE